jgi:hypothetical protein
MGENTAAAAAANAAIIFVVGAVREQRLKSDAVDGAGGEKLAVALKVDPCSKLGRPPEKGGVRTRHSGKKFVHPRLATTNNSNKIMMASKFKSGKVCQKNNLERDI